MTMPEFQHAEYFTGQGSSLTLHLSRRWFERNLSPKQRHFNRSIKIIKRSLAEKTLRRNWIELQYAINILCYIGVTQLTVFWWFE